MKIAVTYHEGEINGHFGHAEEFCIYETEGDKILSSATLIPEGSGHTYMTNLMKENGVGAVLCTSMGVHAMAALTEAGIDIVTGVVGSAEEAVQAYLSGELQGEENPAEGNECGCGGGCGSGEEDGCGGGCGGCGGGCGTPQIIMEGTNAGRTVRVHYRGTLDDGTQFDASYDRGEPLEFICGVGMMITGFDRAVLEMEVGQEVDIHLSPEEAYGPVDPNAVFTLEIVQLPGSENLNVGDRVQLMNQMGQPVPVSVQSKDDTTITFDANHELAGKALNFHIEMVEILDSVM